MKVKEIRKAIAISLTLISCFAVFPLQSVSADSSTKNSTLNSCPINSDNSKGVKSFDVVILGGTPSGVSAAVTASKQGLKVALLSQGPFFGGAISNGLVATDIGQVLAISGYPKEFFKLFQPMYGKNPEWRLEPKVAEEMFNSELVKAHISTERYVSVKSVGVSANQINSLTTNSGGRYCGRVFIDATYTGDLLALAGIKYHLNYSDLSSYGETQTRKPRLKLIADMTGENASHTAKAFADNPYIKSFQQMPPLKTILNAGMPSMTYRLCVTKVDSNKVSFAKGPNYEKWAPSWKLYMKYFFNQARPATMSIEPNGTILTRLWQIAKIPNNKYDLNSGRSSFTNVPVPSEYYSDPSKRVEINKQLAEYLQDFLYFVQNEDSVPNVEQVAIRDFGLCKDEFVDNHNFPYEPYVRAGQRLIGVANLTTTDVITNREKVDSVAIGSYRLDMKPGLLIYSNNQLFQDWSAFFRAPVYEIPFGTMLPKQGVGNLITSVSISASPLAYSSLRMEVQFMALGQVAGIASALAIKENKQLAESMYGSVQSDLRKVGAIYKIRETCKLMSKHVKLAQYFDAATCVPHAVVHKSGKPRDLKLNRF